MSSSDDDEMAKKLEERYAALKSGLKPTDDSTPSVTRPTVEVVVLDSDDERDGDPLGDLERELLGIGDIDEEPGELDTEAMPMLDDTTRDPDELERPEFRTYVPPLKEISSSFRHVSDFSLRFDVPIAPEVIAAKGAEETDVIGLWKDQMQFTLEQEKMDLEVTTAVIQAENELFQAYWSAELIPTVLPTRNPDDLDLSKEDIELSPDEIERLLTEIEKKHSQCLRPFSERFVPESQDPFVCVEFDDLGKSEIDRFRGEVLPYVMLPTMSVGVSRTSTDTDPENPSWNDELAAAKEKFRVVGKKVVERAARLADGGRDAVFGNHVGETGFSLTLEDVVACRSSGFEWPNWNMVGFTLMRRVLPLSIVQPNPTEDGSYDTFSRVFIFERSDPDDRTWSVLTHVYLVQHLPPWYKSDSTPNRLDWSPLFAKVQCLDKYQRPIRLTVSLSTDNCFGQDVKPFLIGDLELDTVAYIKVTFWAPFEKSRYRDGPDPIMAYVRKFGFLGIPREATGSGSLSSLSTIARVCNDPVVTARLRPEVRSECRLRNFVAPEDAHYLFSRHRIDEGIGDERLIPRFGNALVFAFVSSASRHAKAASALDIFRLLAEKMISSPVTFVVGRGSFDEWTSASLDWTHSVGTVASLPGSLQIYNLVKGEGVTVFVYHHRDAVVMKKLDIQVFSNSVPLTDIRSQLEDRLARLETLDARKKIAECVRKGVCTFVITGSSYVKQRLFCCRTCSMTGADVCCEACVRKCHAGHDIVESVGGGGLSVCACFSSKKCLLKMKKDPSLSSVKVIEGFNSLEDAVLSTREEEKGVSLGALLTGEVGEFLTQHHVVPKRVGLKNVKKVNAHFDDVVLGAGFDGVVSSS